MLRAGVFVDLYSVVRQAVLAGVESYSIKKLEPLFGFEREENLAEVRRHLAAVERALELGEAGDLPPEVLRGGRDLQPGRLRGDARGCATGWSRCGPSWSTPARRWTRPARRGGRPERGGQRAAAGGRRSSPPSCCVGRAGGSRRVDGRAPGALAARAPAGVAPARGEGQLVGVLPAGGSGCRGAARREVGVSGLRLRGRRSGAPTRCPIHRYSYPLQEFSLKEGDTLHAGEVRDRHGRRDRPPARRLDIKKTADGAGRPSGGGVRPRPRADDGPGRRAAPPRPAGWRSTASTPTGRYRAARDLLLALPPRFAAGAAGLGPRGRARRRSSYAQRLALELDHGALPVQGPPGSGKTYSGARMICELVAAGKRVGITANSHKVIRNLLDEVVEAAAKRGTPLTLRREGQRSLRGRSPRASSR